MTSPIAIRRRRHARRRHCHEPPAARRCPPARGRHMPRSAAIGTFILLIDPIRRSLSPSPASRHYCNKLQHPAGARVAPAVDRGWRDSRPGRNGPRPSPHPTSFSPAGGALPEITHSCSTLWAFSSLPAAPKRSLAACGRVALKPFQARNCVDLGPGGSRRATGKSTIDMSAQLTHNQTLQQETPTKSLHRRGAEGMFRALNKEPLGCVA